MKGIVIVFSKEEDGKKIGRALERNGFQDAVCCSTGAQALQEASMMDGGIVISSVRLKDMHCSQLREYLPEGVELLVIGSEAMLSDCPPDVMTVSSPIRVFDLVNTVRMMMSRGDRRRGMRAGDSHSQENVRRGKTRSPEDAIFRNGAWRRGAPWRSRPEWFWCFMRTNRGGTKHDQS